MMKEEYIDFLRGITPLFSALLERIVARETALEIRQYCSTQTKVNRTMFMKWDEKKVETNQTIRDVLTSDGKWELRSQVVTSAHLVKILDRLSDNLALKKLVDDIRKVEEKVRNPVAHCITYMNEEVLKAETGYSADRIFHMLKRLGAYAGIKITDDDLESYELCNQKIISLL